MRIDATTGIVVGRVVDAREAIRRIGSGDGDTLPDAGASPDRLVQQARAGAFLQHNEVRLKL